MRGTTKGTPKPVYLSVYALFRTKPTRGVLNFELTLSVTVTHLNQISS